LPVKAFVRYNEHTFNLSIKYRCALNPGEHDKNVLRIAFRSR
jgi:hypothetical protein